MIINHYLELLYHYRKLLIATVGSIVASVIALSYLWLLTVPLYTGTASVTILPTDAELTFTKTFLTGSQFNPANMMTQTQIEYLLSRPVAEKALALVAAQSPGGFGVAPQSGLGQIPAIVAKTLIRYLRTAYNFLNSGEHVTLTPYEDAVETLMDSIELEVVEGSYVLEISVTLPDPKAAAIVTNSLAEAYVQKVREDTASASIAVTSYLEQEIAERENKLNSTGSRMVQTSLVNARESEQASLQDDKAEYAQIDVTVRAQQASLPALQSEGRDAVVKQEIAASQERMKTLQTQIAGHMQTLAAIETSLGGLSSTDLPLQDNVREKEQLQNEIGGLRDRLAAVELSKASVLSQIRVISPATIPFYASYPKVVIYTAIGFAAALAIAGFVLILLDTVSSSVTTLPDLRRLVGERALGRLSPSLSGWMNRNLVPWEDNLEVELQKFSGEAISRIAALGGATGAAIQVTGFGQPTAVASISVALAATLAQAGRNVVCDRRGGRAALEAITGSENHHRSDENALVVVNLPNGSGQRKGELVFGPAAGTEDFEPDMAVVCLGPIDANFRWDQFTEGSSVVICVPAGIVTEGMIEEVRTEAEKHQIRGIFFVLLAA